MATTQEIDDAIDGLDPTKPATNYTPDLKAIADGDYRFAIVSGKEDVTSGGQRLVKLTLELLDGGSDGKKVQHTYWLTRKDNTIDLISLDILNRDLATLGFDTAEWKQANKRPWSKEIGRALKNAVGIQFEGKKVTKDGHPRLYVNKRCADDGKPEKFGPAVATSQPVDVPF